jgi:hypothetical protein
MVADDGGRRLVRLFTDGMLIGPSDFRLAPIDTKYLGALRAEVGEVARDRRSRTGRIANVERGGDLSFVYFQTSLPLVASTQYRPPSCEVKRTLSL